MLHISQVFYKKEQSDAAKEGRPIKDFGEFAKHLNQHIYNNSIFAGKVHDNIVKILLKTQLVVEQKYAIIGGGDGAKDSKGVISKNDQGRKEQQVAGMRDHTELPTHPEHSEKSSQSKDELDVKLHEIIRTNPEITQKIEENGGYDKLKQQLVKIAKELFGISEAQAAPVAALGMAGGLTEGTAVAGTALGGTAALTAIMNAPKDALVTWLFENIGDEPSGQILKIALTLAAEPESVMNIIKPQPQSEFEKRKHDDRDKSSSTTGQQHKTATSSTFMPSLDPGDLEPDDEDDGEKKTLRKQNCEKSESPIWKELESYKGGIKTNGESGSKARFYEWDYLHNEIEVYGPKGKEHLGAMCPRTGRMIKGLEIGRTIRQKVN
ncbi:colicin E3/pyocin S6 family cytotoxin [Candidatus Tisiphia endosymbiont of Oplodontha viridula]|uniref:colicin E3/pyocin S6 family cytotoxin n=1 Tax=Candidatus Tisiphia endosymbiont of Oplodontha viridula TaxID=3077925 RepID=UPI0035C8CDB8